MADEIPAKGAAQKRNRYNKLVGNKSQNELKIECGNEATTRCSQGVWATGNDASPVNSQKTGESAHCALHSQYTRDIVPPGLACQRLHLKYIFVENWATAAKTKNNWCVCVCLCFLSHFRCLRIAVRNEFNGNLFCLLLKNCQLHTQFSFNYAICNLRLWPRQLIITWSHLLHSQHRWVRVTGDYKCVCVWVWVRGPGRFAPHRAWIFINFHNLCAGCEHWNNLSRSGCCPFAFMAARLFKY